MRPPVYAMRTGINTVMIGVTMRASSTLGVHPTSMNSAVMIPNATNAPMLGITMPDR